jgi:hypothetical protein
LEETKAQLEKIIAKQVFLVVEARFGPGELTAHRDKIQALLEKGGTKKVLDRALQVRSLQELFCES